MTVVPLYAHSNKFSATETTALSVEPGPSTLNNEADQIEPEYEEIESINQQGKRSEEEIEEAINQADKIENEFVNVVKRSKKSTPYEFNCQFTKEDEEAEYLFRNHEGSPFLDFEIELEKTKCPRFACACHTSDIAIRLAIVKHLKVSKMLKTLSSFAASNKASIIDAQLTISKKSKLQCDNFTRWFSSYLMLQSFRRAYLNGVFSDEYQCPYALKEIETYLQILLPAYQFSLIMQKNFATISDVLPSLMIMLSKWERMILEDEDKQFCYYLIAAFKFKFQFELNSNICSGRAIQHFSNGHLVTSP